jgi:hypothetical protein
MIWTVENTVDRGNPVRVFDANGEEIHFCLRADDQTGECVIFRNDPQIPGRFVFTRDRTDFVRRRIICKAPLRVIPDRPDKTT